MEQTLIRSPHNSLVLRGLDGIDHPLNDVTLVGREAECQLQLREGHASRYHAKLTVTGPQQILVEDLKSTNGTYVNGQRVETPIVATIGDELRFDTSRFRVATSQSGGAQATVFRDRETLTQAAPARAPAATPPPAPVQPTPPPEPAPVLLRETPLAAEPAEAARPKKIAQFNTVEKPATGTSSLPADELASLASKSAHTVRRFERTDGPRLVILNPPARGMVFPLEDTGAVGEWLIGRGDDADVALSDRTVSTRHAAIRKTGTRWEIENLNATNGVFVNGKLISRKPISSGDKIRLGRTELQFRTDDSQAIEAPAPPSPSGGLSTAMILAIAGTVFIALFALILILVLQRGG